MNDLIIEFTLNGKQRKIKTEASLRLLDIIRDELKLTGTKEGCGKGECGACTVIMNNELVASCLILAPQADGAEIITIEGLSGKGELHPIQDAFIESGAVQCGFCIPGMILAAKKILDKNLHPGDEEIKRGISGNICRCTGYQKIFDAIRLAGEKMSVVNTGKVKKNE